MKEGIGQTKVSFQLQIWNELFSVKLSERSRPPRSVGKYLFKPKHYLIGLQIKSKQRIQFCNKEFPFLYFLKVF